MSNKVDQSGADERISPVLAALSDSKHWHQGDKWRNSSDPQENAAWQAHMNVIDAAIAALQAQTAQAPIDVAKDLLYVCMELSGVIAEYRSMPCGSLQERMFQTLDRYMPRINKARSVLSQAAPSPTEQASDVRNADCYSHNDGDSWCDCPDDIVFVHGLKVGDEYEVLASVRAWTERYRVTKAPDDDSDDYEVELVATPADKGNAPVGAKS